MKKTVLFLLLSSLLFACEGDCMKCHPVLLQKKQLNADHKVLATCVECHQTNNDDLGKMGALCGQDCWDCHSVAKVKQVNNPSHMVLDECIKCHSKLDKNLFEKYNLFSPVPTKNPPSLFE